MGNTIHWRCFVRRAFTVTKTAFWEGRALHLDHHVSLKVILKALELELQNWREVIKQHAFTCILQHKHYSSICIITAIRKLLQASPHNAPSHYKSWAAPINSLPCINASCCSNLLTRCWHQCISTRLLKCNRTPLSCRPHSALARSQPRHANLSKHAIHAAYGRCTLYECILRQHCRSCTVLNTGRLHNTAG